MAGGVALLAGAALVAVVAPRATPATSAVAVPPGITPPAAPGSPGVTVAGVRCGPLQRQLPWSAYAPVCLPAWHGDNGGATANGVTRTTITLTYRMATTDILSLLYAEVPQTVVGTNAEAVHTMQSYIDTFNHYFELYGRKVVLRPYVGQGDFISEDQGSGLAQAQEDALTVADNLHGFADMSLIDSSVIYADALQQAKVPVFGLYLQSAGWYQRGAPYQYTVGPDCTASAAALADILGSSGMANARAAYAGPALRDHRRVYGVVYPDNPQAVRCEQLLAQRMAAAGHPITTAVGYEFDVATLQTAAQNAIGQLQSSGVTTVICASCDPVSPIYFLRAANQAGYSPEFVVQSYFAGGTSSMDGFVQNIVARSGAGSKAGEILALGSGGQVTRSSEALRAYAMANGGSTSGILPSYPWAYDSLLLFFDLLQAAGPDLTPATLHRAMSDVAELPPSAAGGSLGPWSFGTGRPDPSAGFELLRWNPGATSPEDGRQGTFVACYAGRVFSYAAPGGGVPANRSPSCP